MRERLRTALVCLLMLVLPIQTMSAFGMQLCQQAHGSGALQAMSDHGGRYVAMIEAGDVKPAVHHSASSASCSLCAFCVSAVLLNQPLLQPGPGHRAEPPQAMNERLVSVIPDTPERPPRLFF